MSATARNGRVFSSRGTAWASADGHVVYQIDPAPPGFFPSSYGSESLVASNGTVAAFVWNDYRTPASSLVTAVDGDGRTIWRRSFSHVADAAAVDDSGITLLRFYPADLMAIDADGRTLYTQTADGYQLQAANGRFHLGGRTVSRVADGTAAATLPFDPAGSAILTGARLFVSRAKNSRPATLASVDLGTADIVWERPLLDNDDHRRQFSLSGDRTVFIDPQHLLHVLSADGADVIGCKVAPDVSAPVLLPGGRLALARDGDIEVYDLP